MRLTATQLHNVRQFVNITELGRVPVIINRYPIPFIWGCDRSDIEYFEGTNHAWDGGY